MSILAPKTRGVVQNLNLGASVSFGLPVIESDAVYVLYREVAVGNAEDTLPLTKRQGPKMCKELLKVSRTLRNMADSTRICEAIGKEHK